VEGKRAGQGVAGERSDSGHQSSYPAWGMRGGSRPQAAVESAGGSSSPPYGMEAQKLPTKQPARAPSLQGAGRHNQLRCFAAHLQRPSLHDVGAQHARVTHKVAQRALRNSDGGKRGVCMQRLRTPQQPAMMHGPTTAWTAPVAESTLAFLPPPFHVTISHRCVSACAVLIIPQQRHQGWHSRPQRRVQAGIVEACRGPGRR